GCGERVELGTGSISVGRGVDRLECCGHGLAVAVGHEPQRVADQMHHTGLNGGLRPGGRDRLGEAGQPVAADDQHVADAAVGQIGTYRGPKRRSFVLLDPDAQDVLDPGHIDAHGDVSGLVAGVAAVFDLDDDRVEVYHRVD